MIHTAGEEKISLYNLAKDPWEKTNLAKDEAERVKKLTAKLDAWYNP